MPFEGARVAARAERAREATLVLKQALAHAALGAVAVVERLHLVDRRAAGQKRDRPGLIAALVIAYGFARLADMVGADSVGDCIALAVFAWVSFTATVQAMQINFSPGVTNKASLFAIEGGFHLVSFAVIGAIIGAFQ